MPARENLFTTSNIILSFIILILAIGIGYWLNRNNYIIGTEGFDGDIIPTQPNIDEFPIEPNPFSSPSTNSNTSEGSGEYRIPSTTSAATMPQGTIPLTSPPPIPDIPALPASVTQQLDSFTDAAVKASLESQLLNLQNLLARYARLDVPIIMNDAGQICNMWGNYAAGKYSPEANQCLSIDDSGVLKCLDNSSTPSRCSKLFTDGYIASKNTIDYTPLLNNITNTIIQAAPITDAQIATMNQDADTLITSFADRTSIQQEQKDIINNNNLNMEDKKKIIEKEQERLSDKQNETNLNQSNFREFRDDINNSKSKGNIYYKILFGLIVTIIIMGILNFLFSNILA